ncbi:MAG: PilT/PilU family type 4a pilus ATPase [Acidobacteria bacterium]|nr:PilT/PilU family type 4a pilus ATPase [Acidobacteriota bacterium]MCB9396370.1 PilT/PilU family type 4a pilus ATPase [Acidobacteriota bacterium]
MNPYEIGPILRRITKTMPKASDILFSPGHPPKAIHDGQLVTIPIREFSVLAPYQTEMLAMALMQGKPKAMRQFTESGSADLSITLEKTGRFRINIFRQRGSVAIVMRVIPTLIPSFESLGLPDSLRNIIRLKNGVVLITGPTGCGKSSTMAALINLMSQEYAYHIITIEDPIEFLFQRNKSMIHQRELGGDTESFSQALRTALRQAPQVIMVGEMRDTESVEIALEAAETGHLILSTLHTIDAAKTIERIIGVFPKEQEDFIRTRFSQTFRYIVSQRLLPKMDGKGRAIAIEVLKANDRTRSYIIKGEQSGNTLEAAMEDGEIDGMQTFDSQLLRLFQAKIISKEVALQYATNPNNLQLKLGIFGENKREERKSGSAMIEDATLDGMPIIGLDRE